MGVQIDIPADSPFTIHNIPYGVISTKDNSKPRCATAIGDHAIDLAVYAQHGRLDHLSLDVPISNIFSEVRLAG
jgi:fumarylacetoacetase